MKWTTSAPIHATRTNESRRSTVADLLLFLVVVAPMVAGLLVEAVWR